MVVHSQLASDVIVTATSVLNGKKMYS